MFRPSDTEPLFRQESYFHWAFGVKEPDYFGAFRVGNNLSYLFMPRPSRSDVIFLGLETDPEVVKIRYEVDDVFFIDEMATKFDEWEPAQIVLLAGANFGQPCTEASFPGMENFTLNRTALFPAMSRLRAFKTELELDLMRHVNQVSARGHLEVMRTIRPDITEGNTESTFLNYCYNVGGCRQVAYTSICSAGANGAILHYVKNDGPIHNGDMCVYDMGAEYECYTSDITTSFPANGVFTPDQRTVYNAVLAANRAVREASGPGILWSTMQRLSDRVLLEQLTSGGLLQGDIDEMLSANLQRTFCPHGLGHLLGVDTHDVGDQFAMEKALPPPHKRISGSEKVMTSSSSLSSSSSSFGFRMPRELKTGMVFTIEPGIYFIDMLMDEAEESPNLSRFLVPGQLPRFRGFGGVRIEDDVLVTETGVEMLSDLLPRTVDEIEAFMAGK